MIAGSLFPLYYIDAPEILNAFVTNIPGSGSAPVQVVANSGLKAAYGVQYTDTTGDWIGVYIGTVGNEVLRTIIGGGLTVLVPVVIPHNSRVSLRSMTSTAITDGKITMVFLGQGFTTG